MSVVTVQFQDATKENLVAYFSSQQDPNEYPNLGQMETSDSRWKTFYDAQPAFVQQGLPSPQ